MWVFIAIAYFALLFWSAYSVINSVAYWDGYRKGFKDGLRSRDEINQKLLRRNA